MCALFPNVFPSSAIGWQLEESMIDVEVHQDDLFASYATSSPDQLPEFEYPDHLRNSTTATKRQSANPAKKSSHNEYERHRRKKLNSLYSSLRNLLPDQVDPSRNMSIPCTVGRIVKYIPELQRQIERLIQRKEDILVRASQEGALAPTLNQDADNPIISATCIDRREVMIQICTFGRSSTVPVSKIVEALEGEGIHLMAVSTQSFVAGKTFCSLHLQAKEDIRMGSQSFCEHLMSLLKNGLNLLMSM